MAFKSSNVMQSHTNMPIRDDSEEIQEYIETPWSIIET